MISLRPPQPPSFRHTSAAVWQMLSSPINMGTSSQVLKSMTKLWEHDKAAAVKLSDVAALRLKHLYNLDFTGYVMHLPLLLTDLQKLHAVYISSCLPLSHACLIRLFSFILSFLRSLSSLQLKISHFFPLSSHLWIILSIKDKRDAETLPVSDC